MSLPEITVDMDGVLCRPILWFNFVISRDISNPPVFRERPGHSPVRLSDRVVDGDLGQTLRYGWRPPLPYVREGLTQLAEVRRLVLMSGRPEVARDATEAWLRRHRLRDFFCDVLLNDRGLPNVSFKILKSRERGAVEHIDDDGRVAYFLAKDAARKVFLISYVGNAGLPYPPEVQRIRHLVDVAKLIRASGPCS